MYKLLFFLLGISYGLSLTCSNEFEKPYNQVVAGSLVPTSVCHACAAHCLECTQKARCTLCEAGYYVYQTDDDTSVCKANETIKTGCLTYQEMEANTGCIACDSNYWKNESSCIKKTATFIQKCETWSTNMAAETCSKAKTGYGLTNSGTEFIDCVENCDQCSESQCTQCVTNYHLSDNLKTCIKNEGICKVWKASTIEECSECPAGYTISNNFCFNSECKCQSGKGPYPDCNVTCSQNCDTCSDASTCSMCKNGYYLLGNQCENECKDNCNKCTNENDCSECKPTFYKNGDNCQSCTATNCLVCSGVVCTKCDSSFMLDQTTGQCTTSDPLKCNKHDGTNCIACHDGYYIKDDHTCEACGVTNCVTCSSTACTSCNFGYILYDDGVNKPSCVTCTGNSKYKGTCPSNQWMKFPWTCSDLESHCSQSEVTVLIGVKDQFCQSCESGYKLEEKKCVQCTITNCTNCDTDKSDCNTCATGFFKDTSEETTKCSACPDNCNQCSSSTVCLDCAYGYVFNSDLSACVKCSLITNCEKCWKSDECLECKTGYYLKDNTCVKCSSNCTDCYDATHCLECSTKYFFKEPFLCRECFSQCLVCDNEFTCIQCFDNYILNTDKKECMYKDACKKDSVNCKTCNTVDTTKCAACNDGYYWETTLCKSCLTNCLTCENEKVCKICKENYDLNSDKTECNKEAIAEIACFSLIEGCIKCNPDHLSRCALCAQGSTPNADGKCSCEDGYYLIGGECQVQSTDSINFDSISSAEISDLLTYINKAISGTSKVSNTEKMLKQLSSKLDTIDLITGSQAATLLLSLAPTATSEYGQIYYKEILKNLCRKDGLSDEIYQSSISAADSFYLIINETSRQTIYDYGFTDCVLNYLKKASPADISVMKLKNSEFQIKALEVTDSGNVDQVISFVDTSVVATIDLKAYLLAKSKENKYYMAAQAVNHDGNPFKYTQNNSVMYESKLMGVSVFSKKSVTDTNLPEAIEDEMSGKSFNVTFDFEGTKCGHYNENKLTWLADGNATEKTCQFNRTGAHFVIYQEKSVETINAYLIAVFSIVWIFAIALF